jgi:replicative DNA helicase
MKKTESIRVQPSDMDAEQSVLGAILIDNRLLHVAMERLEPTDFYSPGHVAIFAAMSEMQSAIDIITLTAHLKAHDQLDKCGGPAYIASLPDIVPASAHVATYIEAVEKASQLRALIAASQSIAAMAYQSGTADIDNVLAEATDIFRQAQRNRNSAFEHISTCITKTTALINEIQHRDNQILGMSTGYRLLDQKISGLCPGDLIIIAGRPGTGKTALALNFARNIDSEDHIAIYSIEMVKEQLTQRMQAAESGVPFSNIRNGRLDEQDWKLIIDANDRLFKKRIHINDSGRISLSKMESQIMSFANSHKLGLVIIDYLQLIRHTVRGHNRVEAVGEVSATLKSIAKTLRIPVVALSQLNRDVEQRVSKRPILADLRESGAIEQDADIVMFPYHIPDTENRYELIIAKQRNGPVGTVPFRFNGSIQRFEEEY